MNEAQLLEAINREERIYIYGAGVVGRLVFKRFVENGISPEKICFIVTDNSDQVTVYGRRVNNINEVPLSDGVVVIATDIKYQVAICEKLKEYGYETDPIGINEELRRDMELNHVRDKAFREEGEDIDILLMTSDNYKGSGAFLCAAELTDALRQRGIRVAIVLPEYGEGEDILDELGVEYGYVPSKGWCVGVSDGEDTLPYENEQAVSALKDIIKKRNVLSVHNNTSYTYVGALAALDSGIPFVWHLREKVSDQGCRFINEEYTADLMNRADRIICISEFESRVYPFLKREKIRVIYDGIRESGSTSKKSTRFAGDTLSIVNVGVVTERKGQEDIINAASILKTKEIRYEIRLVGGLGDPYVEKLKQAVIDYGIQEQIHFEGFTDDVDKYYEWADIAIVSSRAEPFGRCTAEAMQNGCLTIGANAGATSELIQDGLNGLLYEPGNATELARIIIETVANEEKSTRIINNGIERGQYFSLDRNADAVAELYRSIWNGRSQA